MSDDNKKSVFAEYAWRFIERGISVVPIAPGTKKPGQWSQEHGWRGMGDWTRFSKRLPTELELEHWEKWPDAGVGVVLGPVSNLTCLDKDYDLPDGHDDQLQQLIPYSPVAKKGEKGWTRFYQYNGERSCSFDVNGLRVLDVLADGRQTVVPPTIHPSGCSYVWISEQGLDALVSVNELPKLPDDFLDQVARLLEPLQTEHDKKYQKKTLAPKEDSDPIDTSLSIQAAYFRDVNAQALHQLDAWVTKLVPTAKPEKDGYRCIAVWRGAKNPNVGIHPDGIRDWGGNYGLTPIDLVMYANNLTFIKAAELLREHIKLPDTDDFTMTVGGVANTPAEPKAATKPVAKPALMPWQVAKPKPPAVMLPPVTSIDPAPALPSFMLNPPGILGDIARWITATAPKSQPELSLCAAIALGSVVMGRTYRSQYGNFTSLYLVMIAKSTEGKEHPQACVEKILAASGLTNRIGGSGYTSSGAVYSALLKEPAHIATIDEMGKLLKVSRAKGQSHSEAALDKLVEAFGRQDGVLRPPTYSTMTLTKAQTGNVERVVHNPAITILGATTPATFYDNLTDDLVKDGFLGRCIIVESKQPRQLTRFVDRTDPPAKIIEWCQRVHVAGAGAGNLADALPADMPAVTIELPFDDSCRVLMDAFENRLNDAKNACEPEGLDVLLGRTLEKALKLSMIVCKAENPDNRAVMPHHLEWAIQFVEHYDTAMVRAVRTQRVSSQTDADIKKALGFVKNSRKYINDSRFATVLADGAMPHSKLLKLMKMSARQFGEVVDTAVACGILLKGPGAEYGFPGMDVYRVGDYDE